MLLFIGILVVGYYYAWRKGALEWVQQRGNIYFMPVKVGVKEYLEGIL